MVMSETKLGNVIYSPNEISAAREAAMAKTEPQSFKVGDFVEAFGRYGAVTSTSNWVEVKFEDGTLAVFQQDGKFAAWHALPSLKLIERPKRKETRTVEAWVNVYLNGGQVLYHKKVTADLYAGSNRIACVRLTGSYEVEVEE
jgi:hypothetical protein